MAAIYMSFIKLVVGRIFSQFSHALSLFLCSVSNSNMFLSFQFTLVFVKTSINTCIHKNMTVRKARCTLRNMSCNAPFSSPSKSVYGLPLGTPNSNVTVPLLARYVGEQSRIICRQVTTLPNSCPPSVVANM